MSPTCTRSKNAHRCVHTVEGAIQVSDAKEAGKTRGAKTNQCFSLWSVEFFQETQPLLLDVNAANSGTLSADFIDLCLCPVSDHLVVLGKHLPSPSSPRPRSKRLRRQSELPEGIPEGHVLPVKQSEQGGH